MAVQPVVVVLVISFKPHFVTRFRCIVLLFNEIYFFLFHITNMPNYFLHRNFMCRNLCFKNQVIFYILYLKSSFRFFWAKPNSLTSCSTYFNLWLFIYSVKIIYWISSYLFIMRSDFSCHFFILNFILCWFQVFSLVVTESYTLQNVPFNISSRGQLIPHRVIAVLLTIFPLLHLHPRDFL